MLDIPVDALLICYGPLFLTIVGFVLFAALTDGDARRTYLRRLDMRPEDEAPEVLEPVITKRVTAQTPSGARVTLVPPGEAANGDGGVAITTKPPTSITPPPAENKPQPPTTGTAPQPPGFEPPPVDDLPPADGQ